MISMSDGSAKAIGRVVCGDWVCSFDGLTHSGRGALVPRRVVRIYRNTTTEWIRLTWVEDGERRELVATPGHHFLDQFGQFPTIAEMTRTGRSTMVLASGALAEVTAERIVYSAETAHLFERAVAHVAAAGNAALQSVELEAWATYNFEVEDLHTYVAEGVRVHNQSGLWGQIGNGIVEGVDTLVHPLLGYSMGAVAVDAAGRDRSPLSFSCLLRMPAGEGGPGGPSGASELGRLRGVREINGLHGRIHLALRNGRGGSNEVEHRHPPDVEHPFESKSRMWRTEQRTSLARQSYVNVMGFTYPTR